MSAENPPTQNRGAVNRLVSRVGRFVFKYRDFLAPAVGILILLYEEPRPIFLSQRANWWLDLVGVLVALTGQIIRVTVIGYAYIVRGGAKKQLAAPRLVREGFYAHSRNPMYLGNFLLLLGLALIYNAPLVYLIGLPACVAGLWAIVRAEEEFLRGQFGAEYEDYCRTVNRFLPDLRGLRQTLSGMRFDWRRALRKEYGTTFAWTSTAILFLGYERVLWNGLKQSTPVLRGLLASWISLGIWYLCVRWLKKSGRLASPDYQPAA
jgi:protein-S-isoprenylcysteine O-methyltransferase Ste14